MENQKVTEKKRKFLLVLPVLVIPFLTMIFWALGGGKVASADAASAKETGINGKLPDANIKDEDGLDKMSFYDQAQKDSLKRKDMNHPDPNSIQAALGAIDPQNQLSGPLGVGSNINLNTSPYTGGGYNDPTEAKINQKLQQLNSMLNQQQMVGNTASPSYQTNVSGTEQSLMRLEKMMQQMHGSSQQADPETQQLDGLLEKVLDIQNPERVKEKLRKSSLEHRGQVFALSSVPGRDRISLMEPKTEAGLKQATEESGFYSIDEPAAIGFDQNTVSAVIHETQTLINGATVKLRLLDDIFINGTLIPKNNFVFGMASLSGDRLVIKITGIRYRKSQYPVQLSVFDIDGMDGIYIPGAIARDVAKQSVDRAIQDISFENMNPSLGYQAASAGIEAAKSLFSKKVKLIRVTVKAGYQVLLRDEKQKD